MTSGLEVAERIRATVESTTWRWTGEAYRLTISCGVAAYPDTVRDVANLRAPRMRAVRREAAGKESRGASSGRCHAYTG